MNSIRIVPITELDQIDRVCQLAQEIWSEHYEPIIGPEQVAYMLDKFQSPRAVKDQIDDGYQYYFLRSGDMLVGYMSVKPEAGRIFLSKMYVAKAYRQKGIASAAFAFIEQECRANGLASIWLTVNKHNHDSIAVYDRLGFIKVREQVADIGNGYVMDDYIMEKKIS